MWKVRGVGVFVRGTWFKVGLATTDKFIGDGWISILSLPYCHSIVKSADIPEWLQWDNTTDDELQDILLLPEVKTPTCCDHCTADHADKSDMTRQHKAADQEGWVW